MAYESKAVANYLLDLARRDGIKVDPMKLQKLVYFAHGWHLAITKEPLIDEHVEAWQFGPVIPSLYHEFKEFGSSPIRVPAIEIVPDPQSDIGVVDRIPTLSGTAKFARALLDRIWELYRGQSGVQLSNMTHEPGTPWDQTWKTSGGRKYTDIDDELIEEYFREKLNAAAAAKK